jgi:hypothetical protein
MAAEREALNGFKRLNFFKGLVTTEADWIDEQQYRLAKQRLHAAHLHAPGVVRGYAGELAVNARGDLSVEVQPGCAVDGQGNEIVLWETQVKSLGAVDNKNEQLVYLVIRFAEQATDFIAYKHNLAIRGHRRMLETCEIEVQSQGPKLETEVELCRVLIEKGARAVRDPRDPLSPKPNEVNTLYVPHAGIAGSAMSTAMRTQTDKTLITLRVALRLIAGNRILSGHDALAALVAAQALHNTGALDRRNLPEVIWPLVEMLAYIHDDVRVSHPELAQRKDKELNEYLKHMQATRAVVWQSRASDEGVRNLYFHLQRAADLLNALVAGGQPTMIKAR